MKSLVRSMATFTALWLLPTVSALAGQVDSPAAPGAAASYAFQMEAGAVTVGGAHVTVQLTNTYFDPIVVATAQYSANTKPVVTRVSNVTSTSFDLRLQNPSGVVPAAENVSYWVVERGVWTVDGVKLEADRYLSTQTSRKGAWLSGDLQTYGQVYAQPVVVGQVMSENDPRWSVFFAQGANHLNPPNATTLKTGKHIGEDTAHARANETIGYIVVEAVHTTLAAVEFEAAQGLDTILGVSNGPPFPYTLNNPFGTAPTVVVASSAGMDGGDGGWAQTHGPAMATTTRLFLSIDEDQIADVERSHTSEQVTYAAFSGPMVYPVPPMCDFDVDCDDGAFCNGAEQCDGNQVCRPGDDPCPGQLCDENSDSCIAGVTAKMESVSIPAGTMSVSLVNSYASPVIACTPVYDANGVPVVVRVSNVTSNSFSAFLQNPGDLTPVDPDPINCLVVEEGSWNFDGHPVEARKYLSVTTDKERNWLGTAQSLTHGFTNPVVLGQVMSANDARWSVYWQRGTAQNQPPSASALRNGKTVCEDPDGVRADETIGFIVFEQSNGTIAGVPFEAALGPDTVSGVDNGAPFDYTFNVPFSGPPAFAVATQAGMDGSDGSWAYLYGSTFATATRLSLAVDEDQIFNAERGHTTEQVGYVAFEAPVVFPQTGCTVDAECDDGNYCNGVETCNVGGLMAGSVCQAGTPVACDDGVGCTDDSCNEATDSCVFMPNDSNCANGQFCDGTETCDEFSDCQTGTPVDCGTFSCDEVSDTCVGGGPVARMEWGFVENVGDLLTRVNLQNTYVDPVIVVSVRYANNTAPVVARVTNVFPSSFDVYLQNPSGNLVLPETVDYIVVEKGTWVIDGVAVEAQKYLSTKTAHDGDWSQFDVQVYGQAYTNPVVLGQVMSTNDARFSAFWSRGSSRTDAPSSTALNTGKMVGEDPNTTRANETIGFIVIEARHGFLGGVEFEAKVSTDSVAGVVSSPPYIDTFTTSFPGPPQVAVAVQTAMDGFNGGWMYTFGALPASATVLDLAGDEDQLSDAERTRATEQAGYAVFQTPGRAGVDDPPVAVADAATVAEDSGATAVNVLANDTDVDAGPISITSVTQPANGAVVITGGGTGLTYAPNANYCNNPPGTTLETFTYTLTPGSSSTTVTMTVTCVDDDPVAGADAATVAEDSGATAVNVLANDTDVDAGPISITSVTQPTNGAVVITGGGTGLTYAPNANYCNNPPGTTLDTFTYALTPGSSSTTVTMTVTCVDDPPVAVADAATVAEDSGATAFNVLANDTDVDAGPISIISVTQPANGAVVITGGGTGLTYAPNANYCNNPPGTTLDTFTYTLTPGSSSTTVTMTVTCVDDDPVAGADAATVAEDSGATAVNVLANDTDVDAGPISITSVTQPANGAVVISGGGTGLTYAPNANYCNTPPGTTLDTFTYTLTPGGSVATVTMTVTCVNDDPVTVADSATVTEDDPATAVNVLANDTDPEADPFTISSVTQPANGTVVITGGGTGLTYQPNANYCNTPPGTTLDTFTYTLTPGGSVATVTMTVTCVDDDPVAVADSATVVEDSGANAITVLANDTDLDGGAISITSVTQPANGTVVITGGGTGLAYAPNANYCNTPPGTTLDTFTYTLTPGGSSTTVTMTVTCVDDPPAAVAEAATVNEDSGATAIAVLANDTDLDGGAISITSVTQPTNGVVVITGGGTGLTYAPNLNYCNNPPGTTLDTFTYTLAPGGSFTTVTMTVTCLNDGPTIDLDADDSGGTAGANYAITFNQGDPAKLLEDPLDATVTDVDSATLASLTVTISNLFDTTFETLSTDVTGTAITANYATVPGAPGTGTLTLTGPDTVANFQTVLRKVRYENTDTSPDATPRIVNFVANDGTNNGNTAVSTVTVVPLDVPPTAVADAATVNEDSGATAFDVLANDTDPDGGTKLVASVTQPANGTVAITGGGTGLTYAPNANYCTNPPGTTLDTFTYTLTPGGSSTTVTVAVICVDDPPVAVADAATVVEDSGTNAIPVLTNDTDVDAGPKSVASVTQPANGSVVITGGGTGLTYAPNANYCNNPPGTTLDTFTYTLTPGGSVATVTMTVTCVNDLPVADNDTFDFIGNTDLVVDLPPLATPHALETTGTTFGVIDGDSDPVEGNAIAVSAITVGACTDNSAPFDCTDPAVGRVQMQANGRFQFTPAAGDTGATETFSYIVTDDGVPPASTMATVTLTRFERVWYVDPNVAGGGNGTSPSPFNTLNSLDGVGGAGDSDSPMDYIFVHDGTLALSAPMEMEANQRLIGEGVGLSIPVNLNGNGSPTVLVAAGTRPQVTNAAGDAVIMNTAIPIEIVGLSLQGSSNAIDLTTAAALTGSATLTIGNNEFRGASTEGIDVNLNASTTGTLALNVTNNIWNAAGTHTGNAIDIARTAGTLNLNLSNNTGVLSAATAINIAGGAAASTTITGFANNTVHQNTVGSGILVSNATFDTTPGAPYNQVSGGNTLVGISGAGGGVGGSGVQLTSVAGDLAFTDLDVFADAGAGVQISGTGAVNVGAGTGTRVTVGAGVAIVEATGGPALDLASMTADFQLTSLKSTTSPSTGVSLLNVADGTTTSTISAGSSSSITGATGNAFNLNGGNATVSYAGTINNTAGKSVVVANRTADIATFTGAVTDTGTGISLTSNTGSTIAFTGALSLTTGANTAFNATGGGTVTTTNATSTLTTTTGTALNVASTTIGAAGLTFQSISAGTPVLAPANGIVLNTTGTLGRLTVTGTGTAGSGGTIQNTIGVGVALTSTANISLSRMQISNTGSHGISGLSLLDGTAGANPSFALLNSRLTSPGDADNETAIFFGNSTTPGNSTGLLRVANTIVEQFEENGIEVYNNTGSVTLEVTGTLAGLTDSTTKFDDNNDIHGQQGILLTAAGTASVVSTVSGVYFNNIESATLDARSEGATATLDVNWIGNVSINGGGPDDFPSGGGFQIVQDNGGAATFDIQGNTIRDLKGDGVVIIADGASMGRIGGPGGSQGNVISGSLVGDGIRIDTDQLPGGGNNFVATILIQNNQIGNDATFPNMGDDGIQILHRDGTKTLNLTIENNTIANTASEAIRYFQDADVSDGALKPYGAVRVAGNAMSNIGVADAFVFQTQETADLDLHVTGNSFPAAGNRNISLSQAGTSVFQITQASVAALATANTNSTASVAAGTITFNSPITNPLLPTNP